MQDSRIGKRVELHPATDAWMRGDRYGEIVRVIASQAHGERIILLRVLMDRSQRTLMLSPDDIIEQS